MTFSILIGPALALAAFIIGRILLGRDTATKPSFMEHMERMSKDMDR